MPVTSGKPADVRRLGTSIPKFKPVSPYFTRSTRSDSDGVLVVVVKSEK